jgi:glycerol-3-phosphate dehydrogenase
MNKSAVVKEMLRDVKGAQFASFIYTAKGSGEKSKITVILGASTENLYRKDIEQLEEMIPSLSGLSLVAANEILASRKQSLEKGIGQNDAYTCKDVYEAIEGLPNVLVHKDTGALHIHGLSHAKEVIVKGVHKVVNSSAKTLAKAEVSKTLPSSRFRQYAIENFTKVRVAGTTLVVEE